MFGNILFLISKILIKKYAKEAVIEGAKELVKRTDTKIDDELLDIFLTEATRSNGNSMSPLFKNSIIKSLKSNRNKSYK